jgi:hypothetical protein
VAFDYAQSQDPTVVGSGLSFGTAVLARVAADYELKACVFDGTLNLWESISLFAEQNGIGSPIAGVVDAVIRMDTPEDYDTRRWITQVAEPKLFIHSPDDQLNPYVGAWNIFLDSPQPKYFLTVQGNHVTEAFVNPDVYRSVVNGWLDGILRSGPSFDPVQRELLSHELDLYLNDLTAVVPLVD